MTKTELLEIVIPLEGGYVPREGIQAGLPLIDLVTITAPRGMGKDTTREETGYPRVTAVNIRDPRSEEVHGVDYWFKTQQDYPEIVANVVGGEYVQYGLGVSQKGFYASEISAYSTDEPCILDIISSQVEKLRALPFGSVNNFYLTAQEYEIWRERWAGRGPMHEDEVRDSLEEAAVSLQWGLENPDVTFVINGERGAAAKDIRKAVETPGRYTKAKEIRARNAAAKILRNLKVELGGRPLVV